MPTTTPTSAATSAPTSTGRSRTRTVHLGSFGRQTAAGLRMLLVMTVLVGVLYPAVVWAVGQAAFRDQASGSLVRRDGVVVGSSLLGQQWTGPQWFHSRPSVSEYAGDTSGGSNLTAKDPRLLREVAQRWAALGAGGASAPADALTTSASGLDPHISPEYAAAQVSRVARARGLRTEQVRRLVTDHTRGRTLGYLGMPRVDVLELNLALDAAARR
ncbi:potassium-transporting ATPase subunit KdpC [Luteipulveratus sp. YIM 133132]|nr:potassium-transporting ATPase subunit KdpC [Luteipulveratus sp. YIM 133132]MDE9366217.1 potassium-transporting ATPase subunit KdpC [Luteipulveratus sp. YIM 133132]